MNHHAKINSTILPCLIRLEHTDRPYKKLCYNTKSSAYITVLEPLPPEVHPESYQIQSVDNSDVKVKWGKTGLKIHCIVQVFYVKKEENNIKKFI